MTLTMQHQSKAVEFSLPEKNCVVLMMASWEDHLTYIDLQLMFKAHCQFTLLSEPGINAIGPISAYTTKERYIVVVGQTSCFTLDGRKCSRVVKEMSLSKMVSTKIQNGILLNWGESFQHIHVISVLFLWEKGHPNWANIVLSSLFNDSKRVENVLTELPFNYRQLDYLPSLALGNRHMHGVDWSLSLNNNSVINETQYKQAFCTFNIKTILKLDLSDVRRDPIAVRK